MKTQIKRLSKSTLAIIMAICMLFSCLMVGTVTASALTSMNGKIYFDNSLTKWSSVYLYVGHGSYAKSYAMTNTDYYNIWSYDFSDNFTDRTKLYFANHGDSPSGQSYGIDTQYDWNKDNSTRTALTTANNSDAGSLFTPSSASAGTLTRSYPRVVAGTIASGGWNNKKDLMTYSGGSWTYTYTNVAVGTYDFAVVGFDDWNTSYRYAQRGTGTGCTIQNANDDDQNMRVVLSQVSNVTITLTSAGKVNVTVTANAKSYDITPKAYTQTYNLTTGQYGTASASTTGGTVSGGGTIEENKTTTLKATAKSGYTFQGWYTNTACTTPASGSYTSASYTVTATANATYYALFKENEPNKHTITVENNPNATITAKWNNQTATNGKTLTNVPEGATVTVTVTPQDGYYVESITPGASFKVSGNQTVSATVTKGVTVTVKSNDETLGTIVADKTISYIGDTITLTITEKEGTFDSIEGRYLDGNAVTLTTVEKGKTYTYKMSQHKDITFTANFKEYEALSEYYYNGYNSSNQPLNGYHSQQMTMAKLDGVPFSYYHVVGRNDEAKKQRFTVSKGKVSGNNANNRWLYVETPAIYDWNQFGDPYIYWSVDNNWGTGTLTRLNHVKDLGDWNGSYQKKLWRTPIKPGSSCVILNKNSFNTQDSSLKQTIDIPDTSVQFGAIYIKTTMNDKETSKFDYAWYSEDAKNGLENAGYTPSSGTDNGIEYFCKKNDTSIYSSAGKTGGFFDYGDTYATPDRDDNGKNFESYNSNYYIIVLHPGETYTINGETVKVTSKENPIVIWMNKLPNDTSEEEEPAKKVNIYAKNGTLRESKFNRFTNLAKTTITSIVMPDGTSMSSSSWSSVSGYGSSYYVANDVPVGSKITFQTKLSPNGETYTGTTQFKDSHYVKGFSINGRTYEIYKWNNSGIYEMTWTVEDVNTEGTKDNKTIEITPIYYLKNNANTKTFYIDGFTEEMEKTWGNMLCVYPYYQSKTGDNGDAFGGYPGQPMLYWGGKYQMEIPLTVDGTNSGSQIKGLTIHNGYWDLLHKSLDTNCAKAHRQSYDYDDFHKIYKEKGPQSIFFWFKYRTKLDNFGDGGDSRENLTNASSTYSLSTAESGNGVEVLKDYYGRQVDIFGTLLTDTQKTSYTKGSTDGDELLIVSNGDKSTYVGGYATVWAVYKQNTTKGSFTRLGYISPSMLYLNSLSSRNTYTNGNSVESGMMGWPTFENTYTTLKTSYKGTPVLITYEKEIWNDNGDKANRSDGKWFYSMGNEMVQANIKIQYTDNATTPAIDAVGGTDGWQEDNFTGGTNGQYKKGKTTGASAYFTNTTPKNLAGKTESGDILVDNNSYFTFQADSSDDYRFVGWVRYSGGQYYEITSQNGLGRSNISANDTYIARFAKVQSGTLRISHNVIRDDTHTGTGSRELTVEVKNGNTVVEKFYSDNGSALDISKYISENYSNYDVVITVVTKPDEDCSVADRQVWTASEDVSGTYLGTRSTKQESTDSGEKVTTVTHTYSAKVSAILASGVTTLRYRTYLTKADITYKYEIVYHYTSRFFGDQSFTKLGTISDEDDVDAFTKTKLNARLTDDFIIDCTPFETNFMASIRWNYSNQRIEGTGDEDVVGNNTAPPMTKSCVKTAGKDEYTLTAHVYSAVMTDETIRAEFLLPYKYNADVYKADGSIEYHDNSAIPLTVYDNDGNESEIDGESAVYVYDDDNYESFTLRSTFSNLFQYDESVNRGKDDQTVFEHNLVQAAPYVIKFSEGREFKTKEDVQRKDGTYSDEFGNELEVGDTDKLSDGSVVEQFDGYYTITTKEIIGVKISDKSKYEKLYFTRWDIFTTNNQYVASTFNQYFNFSGYDDYIIIPVYDKKSPGDSNTTYDGGTYESDVSATITRLGDTRNQWNNGDSGKYQEVTGRDDATVNGDKIFTDFAISFSYMGRTIREIDYTDKNITLGVFVERLGKLETQGGQYITDSTHYVDKYHNKEYYDPQSAVDYAKAKVEGRKGVWPPEGCEAAINSEIGNNKDGFDYGSDDKGIHRTESKISNMNRLKYFYTFTNVDNNGEKLDKTYAYRISAYIYVKDPNTDEDAKVVVSDPVYFTIYDTATR